MKGNPSFAILSAVIAVAAACNNPTSIIIEPLRVINWSPGGGSFCIDPNVTVYATFSDGVQPETLTAESFFLLDSDGAVATAITYDEPNFTGRLTPSNPLEFGRIYTIVATTEVRSADKGRLPVKLEASFETVPRTGCAPGVECTLPSDCPSDQVCANIGVCTDECITDKDCFRGTCNATICIPDDPPEDAGGGDPAAGDSGAGDPAGGD